MGRGVSSEESLDVRRDAAMARKGKMPGLKFLAVLWCALSCSWYLELEWFRQNVASSAVEVESFVDDRALTLPLAAAEQFRRKTGNTYVEWIRVPRAANEKMLRDAAAELCPCTASSSASSPHCCPVATSDSLHLRRNPGRARLVQSRSPLTEYRSAKSMKAMMFRDPLIRFLSSYEVGDMTEDEYPTPGELEAEVNETYFVQRYSSHFNVQTRMLLGSRFADLGLTPTSRGMSAQQLSEVRELLEQTHFVGIVEHMPVTLCLFHATFIGESSSRHKKLCGRVNADIGEVNNRNEAMPYPYYVYSKIAKYNALDEIVYSIARSVFFDRVAAYGGCHSLWPSKCDRDTNITALQSEWMAEAKEEDLAMYYSKPDPANSSLVFAPLSAAKLYKRCMSCGKRLYQSYVHIHKNAGQTYTDLMENDICGQDRMVRRLKGCVAPYPKDNQTAVIQSGAVPFTHSERPGDALVGSNVLKSIILRDPVQRIVSHHEYDIWYGKFNISRLDQLEEKSVHMKYSNRQIRHAVAAYPKTVWHHERQGVPLDMLAAARNTLYSYHAVGLVEHLRLSACLWSHTLMPQAVVDRRCNEPFYIIGERSNSKKTKKEVYPMRLYATLARQNRIDETFYRMARFLFFQRVASMQECTELWSC